MFCNIDINEKYDKNFGMENTMRIGILGGTFNPIHLGHIELARTAYRELNLDKVWFMPSKNPPHKDNDSIASETDRVNMINLAIQDYDYFEVSDIELKREGITYTSDTLEYLQEKYSEDTFYFIIGADSLINIEKWHRPDILFRLTTFVVAVRDDIDIDKIYLQCEYLKQKYEDVQIRIINMSKIDVSSTEIRKKCKKNHFTDCNIDKKVYDYIVKYSVY